MVLVLEKEKSKELKIMVPTILSKLNIEPNRKISRNFSINRQEKSPDKKLIDKISNNGNYFIKNASILLKHGGF